MPIRNDKQRTLNVVTGLFTPKDAGQVLRQLKINDFSHEDLAIMSSPGEVPAYLEGEPEEAAASGAAVGAAAGSALGALGPLAARAIPGFETMLTAGLMTTTLGGVIGGYLGSLYSVRAESQPGIDIHEELEAGKFLLLVRTHESGEEETAVSLMRANNGDHVEIHTIPTDNGQ